MSDNPDIREVKVTDEDRAFIEWYRYLLASYRPPNLDLIFGTLRADQAERALDAMDEEDADDQI